MKHGDATRDPVERAFLAELEALEQFRISYTSLHPAVPLAREDPDVRRLIEALALFTGRTRIAAERSVDNSFLTLFRQHFPNMLAPVPAMGLLRGEVTARYVDVVEIPRGAEVILSHRNAADREQDFRFRTLAKLRILPIALIGADMFRVKGKGYRLALRFESPFPRNDDLGDISLHVNHLNDLTSSLTVLHELAKHLRGASIVYEKQIREDSQGQPVTVQFGAPPAEEWEYESHEHPLHRARTFFHFPYSELFLTARGAKPPRNWQSFALCLDLDESWPTNLRLSPHAFQLHVVPMENIKKDMADPIECDGTQERWSVRHPDTAARFVPHSLLGVYRMTDDGLAPLEPAVLGAKTETYESVVEGTDEARKAWVVLNLPGAFDQPERVAVEAFWHQPGFADVGIAELKARLTDRYVDGVTWTCESPTVAHSPSSLEDDREGLLQLLSIKNQRFLGRDELVFLLRALGGESEKHFAKLVSALSAVTVKSKPFARRAGGFKYIYELQFDDLDGSDIPRLDVFGRRLLSLLTTWSVEEVVEITVIVPNLDKTFHYA